MRLDATPSLVALQHEVRAHFGWGYEADQRSAAMLREACNHHPKAEACGWTAQARESTLSLLHETLTGAQHIVLVGAGVREDDLEQAWGEGTVFVAADGAVGACLDRVEVVCVVSDLDGEPHLSKAVERNIPLVIHAHGDNIDTWKACLTQWASSGGIPLVLTHQCDDVYEDAYNVGGFTDGDRAACFLLALGVPVERLSFVGYSTDRVGPWSGATDPERKLAKLAWMARVLDLIDPNWVQRRR